MDSISGVTSDLSSAFQSARAGINRGLEGLARDTQTVAHANVDPESFSGDVTTALVDSLQQKLQVQISARMLSATDQTLGTLLNVRA